MGYRYDGTSNRSNEVILRVKKRLGKLPSPVFLSIPSHITRNTVAGREQCGL